MAKTVDDTSQHAELAKRGQGGGSAQARPGLGGAQARPGLGGAQAREEISIGGIVNLVRDYAKQETLGPLKGAGKWLAFGAAGAIMLGVGLSLVLLGLLRLLQTEWDRSSTGSLSWLAYVIVLAACVIVIVLAVTRINKSSLSKEID